MILRAIKKYEWMSKNAEIFVDSIRKMESSRGTKKNPNRNQPKKRNVSRKKSVSPSDSDVDLDVDLDETILNYMIVLDKKSEWN